MIYEEILVLALFISCGLGFGVYVASKEININRRVEGLREAENIVVNHRRKYLKHWRDKPDQYWFARLLEEVSELGMALQEKHEHKPELELTQIAGICINWLEKRAESEE